MKIAMVTPMVPESAIADVMLQAAPHLAQRWDLHIWCPAEVAYRTSPVPVHPFEAPDADVLKELEQYDLVIYVLGDSPWHGPILSLAQRLPGLMVLHDASMTNLVRFTALESGTMDAVAEHVATRYGSAAATEFTAASKPAHAWLRFCAEVPLDELVVENALGAVVHSRWHGQRIAGWTLGDVTVAPLPVPSTRQIGDDPANPAIASLLDALTPDDVLVVTLGVVNANRRIDLLLEALAADESTRGRVHLWAVGPADGATAPELGGLARALGVGDRFATPGRASDVQLQEVLARADVAVALRDPVLEGQSASVLTQLLSGTPVIVYDHAHYSELPDDAVVKVPSGAGAPEIAEALTRLIEHPAERRTMGERGRDHVLRTRSGHMYAEAIGAAVDRALAARPKTLLADDLAAALRRRGVQDEDAVLDAVSDLAFDLFDLA